MALLFIYAGTCAFELTYAENVALRPAKNPFVGTGYDDLWYGVFLCTGEPTMIMMGTENGSTSHLDECWITGGAPISPSTGTKCR
jgi:hypothetical protein